MKKKEKPKVKNKELENSITDKFMEAVKGLGHDTDKLKKEIAKAGKSVSQKITSALKKAQKTEAKLSDKKSKSAKKPDAKIDKVVSKVSKVSAKMPAISSRSVAKPVMPAIDKSLTTIDEKVSVKEASAPAPIKRTRAPRRKREDIIATAQDVEKEVVKEASAPAPIKRTRAPRRKTAAADTPPNTNNESVKEASPAPVKRKRAPRKPKAVTTNEVTPAEVTGSEVDR